MRSPIVMGCKFLTFDNYANHVHGCSQVLRFLCIDKNGCVIVQV